VIVHGPTQVETHSAVESLRGQLPDAEIDAVWGDLGSQRDVRQIASEIEANGVSLDVLVNNAAVVRDAPATNGDGIELTFATNYLAVYLLTRLLLPTITKSTDGRVLIVGSEAHRGVSLNFNELDSRADYERFAAYARSKLAVLLFARELAKRMIPAETLVIAMHPGTSKTSLFRPRNALERIVMTVLDLRAKSPDVAADSISRLTLDDTAREFHGSYVHSGVPMEPSHDALDDKAASRLWAISAAMTGLPD
jgi:NAD(P)-dependent dehydrogenase (short-subunit alcohol dehydrogenase family)